MAAWMERHVTAAAASDFERIAGEALAAVLLRGVDRYRSTPPFSYMILSSM
jgi:hypothetical protein